MKPNQLTYKVVKKGDGKFYPRLSSPHSGDFWPHTYSPFETKEEAIRACEEDHIERERQRRLCEETIVWEKVV